MIPCTICSVTLTGPADYHNHINGRRHQDNVVLQRLSRLSVQDPPRPQQPPPPRQPPQPPRNQGRPRGGGAARPGPAHISPRPHGLNSFDPARSHHAAPPNVNGRGRGRAPRPPPPASPAHRSQFSPPRPPPPRQAPVNGFNNSGPGHQPPGPKKPIGKGYQVDFEVIRNTETETRWKSYDFIPSEGGVTGQPAVLLAPINATRKDSVRGFSSRRITRLRSGNGYSIEFGFNPRNIARGVHIVVAHVTYFVDGRNVSKTLKLRAVVGSPEDHEELQPVKPFEPTPREQLRDDWQRGRLIQNKPQNNAQDFERLPFYDVLDEYWRAVQSRADRSDEAVKIHLQSLLPYRMETETYKDHWTHLLWHEEIAMCNQLKQYDMNGVPVPPVQGANQQHSLTVPGLQEKRPSVIVSDLIAIRKPSQARPVYGGAVTEVRQSDVILQVHGDFPSIRGELWDVRCTVNRLLLRRMHESVGRATSYFDRILFPEPRHQKARVPPAMRLSIDRRISTNPEQKLAIEQIVSLAPGDIPFVIFGPPGTGKTTVVVEAIHQVLTTNPDSRLLVCAPSNSAADLLGVRLSKTYNYLPRKLLRLNALTRPYDALDITLRKHSLVDASGRTFKMPSKEELMSYRIVVTTCFSASTPRALRIEDHFTHIFIDEAGHASEPEIMIPILQNVSRDTRVVLSGDPKQLGPIVHSRPCEALGMAESFLERLTKRPVYKVGPGRTSIPSVVKLLQNYRNHPAILRFPNLVFYGGELQPHADPVLSQKLLRFGQLPRQGFPIIFHSVCGENQREGKSPSYFNIDEATLVKHYVKALLDGNYGLNANQVGVITPYRQQCVKIRQLFQKIGFGAIDVKVTEDWQGQERRVIIISTVRSDPELLHEGALKFLGFVASPKRTNVALTRAQALLIVIGNGHVLTLDPFWNAFIRYVHASGGCRGDDLHLSEGGFSEGQFSGLKKSNRDYLEDIDNEGLWDVLKGATSAWPGH